MSRPFDEARYKGLLEGLEATEIRRSQLNIELRYEAEFFRQRYLKEDSALSRWPRLKVHEFANVTDGPHGYHVVDEESSIVMLTAKNAKDWFSDREGADPIAEWVNANNRRSSLAAGDVILSTRGTVGMCALVTEEVLPANIDQDVARISWADRESFLPEFVVAYLNSAFGQDYLARHASGMVQQGMSLQKVREIPLPLLSPEIQKSIAATVQAALQQRRGAIKKRDEAEQALLRALGLENWKPPEPLTYTRRTSDAFAAERLDSDYFAPRVAELLNKLSEAGLTIGAVAPVRHERFSPGKEGEFDYIEIGNVRADGTAGAERLPQSEAPSRASQIVRAGDVLTSSVRPIRRLSALVTHEQDGYVCSSGFVVLQPRDVSAEVLLTYLRLPAVCELMDLHTSASLYPAISETDLLALPFHPIPKQAEAEIVAAVQSAHAARRQAHALLETAKRAVEIAIEESEAAALGYLGQITTANN